MSYAISILAVFPLQKQQGFCLFQSASGTLLRRRFWTYMSAMRWQTWFFLNQQWYLNARCHFTVLQSWTKVQTMNFLKTLLPTNHETFQLILLRASRSKGQLQAEGLCAKKLGIYSLYSIEAAVPVSQFLQLLIITSLRMLHTLLNRLAGTSDTPSNSVNVSQSGLFCSQECGKHMSVFVWDGRWMALKRKRWETNRSQCELALLHACLEALGEDMRNIGDPEKSLHCWLLRGGVVAVGGGLSGDQGLE